MSDDLILPTDEQVERACRAICEEMRSNPDQVGFHCVPEEVSTPEGRFLIIPDTMWQRPLWTCYRQVARIALLSANNKPEPDVWKCSCGHGNWAEKDYCNNCGTRKEEANALQVQAPRQAETKTTSES